MRILYRLSGPVWIDDGDPNIPGHARIIDVAKVAGISVGSVMRYAEGAGLGRIPRDMYLNRKELDALLRVIYTVLGSKATVSARTAGVLSDLKHRFEPPGKRTLRRHVRQARTTGSPRSGAEHRRK
jgi:hypothetical protein